MDFSQFCFPNNDRIRADRHLQPGRFSAWAAIFLGILILQLSAPRLRSDDQLQERSVAGEAASFGGKPGEWAGDWVVYEPVADSLSLAVDGASEPPALRVGVLAPDSGDAQNPRARATLSRAIQTTEWHSDSGSRFSFGVSLGDTQAFVERRAQIAFSTNDQPGLTGLSSRSGWNILCYGKNTPVGEVEVQAGELVLRVRESPRGELQTFPTGVFLTSGEKVQISVEAAPDGETFGIRVSGGGTEFSRDGLGYWDERPYGGAEFLNIVFSSRIGKPYSVDLSGMEWQKLP